METTAIVVNILKIIHKQLLTIELKEVISELVDAIIISFDTRIMPCGKSTLINLTVA